MRKYTHNVTMLEGPLKGAVFPVFIHGGEVHCGEFVKPNGEVVGEPDTYQHFEGDDLTPEQWYDNPERWVVKKIIPFKGNK